MVKYIRLTFVLPTLLLSSLAVAQVTNPPRTSGLVGTNNGGFLNEITLQKPAAKGTSYLDKNWYETIIYLNSDQRVDGYKTRYDVGNNLVEIRNDSSQEVKAVSVDRLSYLEYPNAISNNPKKLVNSKFVSKTIKNCLLEELTEGVKTSLYRHYYTELIKSNYVPEFDSGERADKIVLKQQLYIKIYNEVYEIPLSRKKFVQFFPVEDQSMVLNRIKTDKLKLNSVNDLMLLAEYINSN